MKQRNEAERTELWRFIKQLGRSGLTIQQIRTIRGQALAGDFEGAKKGYERIMRAKERNKKEGVM